MTTAANDHHTPSEPAVPMLGPGGLQPVPLAPLSLPRRAVAAGRLVLAAAEDVLLVAVDLPLASRRKRLDALPFAIEGMIAEPIAETHVALGPQIGHHRYLAAAVRRETMAGWLATLAENGLSRALIVPEAMGLARPEDGWVVWNHAGRALVRRADGTGFAAAGAALGALWQAAGRPLVTIYGDPVPSLPSAPASPLPPQRPDPAAARFDLRAGAFAGGQPQGAGLLRVSAALVALALAAQGALAVIDRESLRETLARKQDEARAILTGADPALATTPAPAIALARLTAAPGAERPGRFIPLMNGMASALAGVDGLVGIGSLVFDAGGGTLALDIEAHDLAALQRIEAALKESGLSVEAGSATTGNGAARTRMTLRDAGPG